MFKKIMSLTLVALMVMSFMAIPSMAEFELTAENYKRFYNDLEAPSGNFNKEVIAEKTINGGEYVTHVKNVGSAKTALTSNRNPIKVATWWSHKDAVGGSEVKTYPKFTHARLYLGVYEDGDRTGLDNLLVMAHKNMSGSSVQIFTLRQDGRVYPRGDNDNIVENYNKDLWSLRPSVTDESFHKLDFIVDHKSAGQATAIFYLFVDGKFCGTSYVNSSSDRTAIGDAFYGFSFRIESGKNINENTILEAKYEDGMEGHLEFYDSDNYTVTLEDVMQHVGLGEETEEENVIFHTTDIQRYIPGANQNRSMYSSDGERKVNSNVTYDETGKKATITHAGTDEWGYAADVLSFIPFSKTDGRKGGVAYTSYHPRAKFMKISFDQTIVEGSNVRYDFTASADSTAVKFRDNGGKLVVDLTGANGAKTSKGDINGKNRIDWVVRFLDAVVDSSLEEGTQGCYQYIYVNGELVAEGDFGSTTYSRINNIKMLAKNDVKVDLENWSMTLYDYDSDISVIDATIKGVDPTASFKWIEDECGVEKDEDLFVVFAGAESKHYEGEAKFVIAVYAEDRTLLDVSIADFESGVVIGNEEEPRIFDASEYEKPVDYICVYLMEDGIKPLLTQKTISFN